jgi:superfamily II DNA or RNA helicase
MLLLRPQQLTAKYLLYDSFNSGHKAVVYCAPTGYGKTVCFSDIAKEMLSNGVPCMIIVDRIELLEQAKDKLNKNGLYPVIIDPSYTDQLSNLYLASVDTLRNRKFPEIPFLIIDECHKRSFDAIVLYYKGKGAKIMGCTATPVRTGKSYLEEYPDYTGQLIDVYDDMFIASTITEQLEAAYLVPAITTSVELDTSDVKITNTKEGLEYNQKDVFKKFDKPKMYDGVIDNYLKFCKGQRALVFNANVEHSKKMNDAFLAVGISSAHVDGKTPKAERKKIFADFKSGKILVLNNCGVATTGYDEPRVQAVIINRLILSLSLYLQICGRGGRPCPEIGKDHFLIIDHGANYLKHAYWSTEREYFLDPIKASRASLGVAPMVHCTGCLSFIPAQTLICPFCEMARVLPPKPELEASLMEGEFKIVGQEHIPKEFKKPVAKMDVFELENYRVHKKYQVGWLVRQLFARGETALIEYAAMKHYARSWVDKQIELATTAKDSVMSGIWEFIKANPHLSEEQIKDFCTKKMKPIYTLDDINAMMPDILKAGEDFKNGVIDKDGNLIIK